MKIVTYIFLTLVLISCSNDENSSNLLEPISTIEPDLYVTGKFGSNGGDFEFKYFENDDNIHFVPNSYTANLANDESHDWYGSSLKSSLNENNNSIHFIFKDYYDTSFGPLHPFNELFTHDVLTDYPCTDELNWDLGGFRVDYYDENGVFYSTIYGDNSDFDFNPQSFDYHEENGLKHVIVKGLLACKVYKSINHNEFKYIYAVRFKLRFNDVN